MSDDDEYDFDLLDKLIEKHQASRGIGQPPMNQQQLQQPKQFTESCASQAYTSHRCPRKGQPAASTHNLQGAHPPQQAHAASHHGKQGPADVFSNSYPYHEQFRHRHQQQPNTGEQQHPPPWLQQPQQLQLQQGMISEQHPAPHQQPQLHYQDQQARQTLAQQMPAPHGASVVAFPASQHRPVPLLQQPRGQGYAQHGGGQQPQEQWPQQQRPQVLVQQQQQPNPQQHWQQLPQAMPLPPHLSRSDQGQRSLAPTHQSQGEALLLPPAPPLQAQDPQPPLQQQHSQNPHPLQGAAVGPPQGHPAAPLLPHPGRQVPWSFCTTSDQQQHPRQLQQQKQAPAGATGGSHGNVTFTASLTLEDSKRFAVRVTYHEALKAVFGLITGASGYDHGVKGWTFPLVQYKHVMDALTDGRLRTRGVDVTLQQTLPDFVGRMLEAAATRPNDERLYEKLTRRSHEGEQSLDERMMPFQREGVRHGLKVGGRVLIGDEMGLGKTVQACCLLKCYAEDWPALVVVPKSLRETWADALHMWLKLTDDQVLVINGPAEVDKLRSPSERHPSQPRVIVMSYDTLTRAPEKLRELKLQMVVLDEAHYIKNGKAQRTQAALPLLRQARRAVLLTGTPALSKPAELVPLLQALIPSASIKAVEFSERYSVRDRRYPSRFFGSRNESELNRLLLGTVMVRRLKKDVLKHLPAKRRQQVFVRLPDADMRKLGKMSRELEGIKAVADSMMSAGVGSALAGVNLEQQQTIMRLWRDTAALKAAAVAEYCSDLLEADEAKFLLFAHHKVLLDAVEDKVKSCKARYIRIDGSTDSATRAEYVKRFQEDADVKVAILSIQAAGVGLTMTASSLVVFAELSWVPGDIQQAEDRCHRIGQHTSVNIHFLLVRGSIDEIMWDTLQNKLGNVGKVLDGSGAFIKVDATREVRSLGAIAAVAQPCLDGASADSGCDDVLGARANALAATLAPGADSRTLVVAAGAAPGGGIQSGGSEAGGGASFPAARGGGKMSAVGARRISDFFVPVKAAAGVGPGTKADGASPAGATSKKRGRAPSRDDEVISDDDERDFKR